MRKPPGCCAQCLNENRGDWLRPYGLRVARWAIEERHFRCASDSIDPDERVRAQLEQRLKLHCGSAPDAGLRAVQALILSVKPDILADVARQIAPYLQTQLVISVAAGIRIAALARWLGGYSRIV